MNLFIGNLADTHHSKHWIIFIAVPDEVLIFIRKFIPVKTESHILASILQKEQILCSVLPLSSSLQLKIWCITSWEQLPLSVIVDL